MGNKKYAIEETTIAFEEFKKKYNLVSHLLVGVFDTSTELRALNSVETNEDLLKTLSGIVFVNKDFRRILEETLSIANELEEEIPSEDKEKFIKEHIKIIND